MSLNACLIYYNDAPLLTMTLPLMEGKFDHIYAVDGKFKGYPRPEAFSIDGSSELIEKYGGEIIGSGVWATEMHKRNCYVNKCKIGDVMFIIDSDEMLYGIPTGIFGNILLPIREFDISSYKWLTNWRLRQIIKTFNMAYYASHWNIVDDDRNYHADSMKHSFPRWSGVLLVHMNILRTYDRTINKRTFNLLRRDPILMHNL